MNDRPGWDDALIFIVKVWPDRAARPHRRVGAVVVKDIGRIVIHE